MADMAKILAAIAKHKADKTAAKVQARQEARALKREGRAPAPRVWGVVSKVDVPSRTVAIDLKNDKRLDRDEHMRRLGLIYKDGRCEMESGFPEDGPRHRCDRPFNHEGLHSFPK